MIAVRKARFSFTKLIVDDEEKMATYYHEVYGLNAIQRVQGESSAAGEPFREIIMGPGDAMSPDESLVMFKFIGRPAPRDQESILGFITEDLDALVARGGAAGELEHHQGFLGRHRVARPHNDLAERLASGAGFTLHALYRVHPVHLVVVRGHLLFVFHDELRERESCPAGFAHPVSPRYRCPMPPSW